MRKTMFVVLILLLSLPFITAQEYPILGPRARGMGGAFVAVCDDGMSAYLNPAGIPIRRLIDIHFVYDAKTAQSWDLLTSLEDIQALDLVNNPMAFNEYGDILQTIEQNDPLIFGGSQWGAFYTNDVFSAGYTEYSITTAHTSIDLQRLAPQATSPDFVLNNQSSLDLMRIKFTEYVFGAGMLMWSNDSFVGVNARYVTASTSFDSRLFLTEIDAGYDEFDFAWEDFGDGAHKDTFLTFDVGALLYLFPALRVGVVGRNVLSPSLEITETETLELKAQWRAGFMFQISNNFILAGDYDIIESRYFDMGPEFQQGALGFELSLFEYKFFVRGGVSKNFIEGYEPLIFSGGLGLSFDSFVLDASVQYAPDRETLAAGIQLHIFYRSNL